jgi:transcriptional regulator with XRE-family HTH domain
MKDMMPHMELFAKNLKELIGNRSLTQVAKAIGIFPQTLDRYLLCQREVSLSNLIKIANYFGEDIDVLTGRREY